MIVLAQAAGNELTGFMQQPFVGPVLGMLCIITILLIAVLATLVYVRRRKAAQNAQAIPAMPGYVTAETVGHDMPDLDLLVDTAGMAQTTPVAPSPMAAPIVPPTRTPRKGTFSIAVNDAATTEAVEIMTILRDVMDGHLIVQMGDKTYQNVNNDPEFKERFNKVLRELAQVVGKPVSVQPAPPAPAASVATERPQTIEAEPEAPSLADLMQPDEPAPPRPRPSSPLPAAGAIPGDLPSFKLDDNPYEPPKRGQKKEVKPVPEINIAGAIEAYLQYKINHTPEFQGRSIHIYPSPDGGVSIEVDGRFFDAVGDISDTATREFIANAIQEWQERH